MSVDTLNNDHRSSPGWMFWRKRRYLIACLSFVGFCNVYIMRVNLSVGIVAMTSSYTVVLENGTTIETQDFDWDFKKQGVILSSFFYGYLSTQLLGGWLAARLGGKFVLGIGVFVTALLTILTPPIAATSFYLFVFARILEGLFEGVTYPAVHAIWARWAPVQERSFLVGFSLCGTPLGTVLGLQMSGVLGSVLGWRAIFYITGLMGLVWSIVWLLVVRDRPEDDSGISPEELHFIQNSIGSVPAARKHVTHPWLKILTALPFWAIVVGNFCLCWSHYTMLILLPTLMKDVFDYNLAESGLVTSLPYLMMGLTTQFMGGISDWLQNTNVLSITKIRKLFLSGSLIGEACFLFLAGHMRTPTLVILCLIADFALEGITLSNYYVNCLDIAPQHASVIFGISNTFASASGIISPMLASYIVTDKSAEQWQIIFYIASSLMAVGAVFCGLFISGDRQPWAVEQQPTLPCKNGNTGCLNNAFSDIHEDKS
ncbi:sialin-like isoform X1 [Homalodisca vitripennis]|uniref:sialin-like isoform X1 n=1 Tax=Homalodisca vitripennis TaxID=197043 RepID=UPI001EEC85E1|nr:sialin-like isoform X1 [Homalodisca vitripennis]